MKDFIDIFENLETYQNSKLKATTARAAFLIS